LLHNGLGQYERALQPAQQAADGDELVTSSWGLYELVEAASRCGRDDLAREAAERLAERGAARGTTWAMGTSARARALVAQGSDAEDLHREAIESLGQTHMAAHKARARLCYGEWLRREGRRVDARDQLREAHDMFTTMGADGFAERTRHELLATG